MKNMKKVLAVMTAVSAMAASTSAFAATTVGETDANSIITFAPAAYTEGVLSTGNSIAVDAMPAGIVDGEVTLLVLDYATVETAVADDDILYIDQGTYANSTNPFAGKALGLKVSDIVAAAEAQFATDSAADETLATKTYSYPVKLGYYDADDFAIATASIDVTVAKDAEGGEEGTTISVKWGDITGDDAVGLLDAVAALLNDAGTKESYSIKGYTAEVGKDFGGYLWGDITGDGSVGLLDAVAALLNDAGTTEAYTVNGNSITVGAPVEIYVK